MKDVLEEYGEMLFAIIAAILLVGLFWGDLRGLMGESLRFALLQMMG